MAVVLSGRWLAASYSSVSPLNTLSARFSGRPTIFSICLKPLGNCTILSQNLVLTLQRLNNLHHTTESHSDRAWLRFCRYSHKEMWIERRR